MSSPFRLIRRFNKLTACTLAFLFTSHLYASGAMAFRASTNTMAEVIAKNSAAVNPQEMGSFSAVEPGDWVDKFTGDFHYSIPLFEIGGYPISMTYSSNIINQSEASWVGLGWSLNPGSVKRNMRGLPDDFNAENDFIEQQDRLKSNETYGLGIADIETEILGRDKKPIKDTEKREKNFEVSLQYSTYSKFGYQFNTGLSLAKKSLPKIANGIDLSAKLGLSFGSENGLGISPQLTLSGEKETEDGKDVTTGFLGTSYNSRTGVESISASITSQRVEKSTEDVTASGTIGANILLGNRTYIPTPSLPVSNLSLKVDLKGGVAIKYVKVGATLRGSYTVQRLAGVPFFQGQTPVLKRKFKTYGYINYIEERDYNQNNALYDFNRENEATLNDYTKAYNLAYSTYDMFQVSAQGLSGSYRPHRASPISIVSDGYNDINGGLRVDLEGLNFGLEFGAGDIAKGGFNGGVRITEGHNSGWSKTDLPSLSSFGSSEKKSNSYYRPIYFKQVGTLTPIDLNTYNALSRNSAMLLPLDKGSAIRSLVVPWNGYSEISNLIKVNAEFEIKGASGNQSLRSNYQEDTRRSNPQSFSYFTASEANILDSTGNRILYRNATTNNALSFSRVIPDFRNNNHISRIDISRADGYQYHFALPVYSLSQKEASFNVSNGNQPVQGITDASGNNISSELAQYINNDDNLPVGRGVTEYYNSKTYSPYALNFLLTEVLSPDYFDVSGNGISEDDLGEYVKFNYVQWFGRGNSFKWKSPAAHFETRTSNTSHRYANYNEGRASKNFKETGDATAFYSYGEKEVWYVDTIQSKEKIAIFHTSKSESLFDESLSGEHGSYDSDLSLAKLDSIEIFTIGDFKKTGIPEQTIHFIYSYDLCKLNGDSESGKLTLERMFRTFRDSKKTAFSDYIFSYNNNPNYRSYLRDGWGNFQALSSGYGAPNFSNDIENRADNYIENPFTLQDDKVRADGNASAWRLSQIDIPSGGSLNIDYESDDYAFVQDKRSAKAFTIAGFSNSASGDIGNRLYDPTQKISTSSRNYMYVDITNYADLYSNQGLTAPLTAADYWRSALSGVSHIPIRCLVDITNDNDFEYVKLNAEIDGNNSGIYIAGGTTYGYVKIKEEDFSRNSNKNSIQAISKHALQVAREDFFQKIFLGTLNPSGEEKVIRSLFGFFDEVRAMLQGQERVLFEKQFGSRIDASKSFAVLQDPWYNKFGGGSRVKEIAMSDEWRAMTSNRHTLDGISGWSYSYRDTLINGLEISSGVAEWEPELLNFENLNLESIESVEKRFAAPNSSHYQTGPFGRTIYPTANVGYSKVSVTMIRPSNQNNIQVAPIGKMECLYYTAKDFPIQTDRTRADFQKLPPKNIPPISVLGTSARSIGVASQGFSVILNDMHGKKRMEKHYKASQTSAYKTINYNYQSTSTGQSSLANVNQVQLLNKNGVAYNSEVGIDYDITVDTKEHFSRSTSIQANPGLDISLIFIPIPIPSFFQPPNSDAVLGRSITTTKVISKYGVLQSVETIQDGAKMLQENLAYDEDTGQPILIKGTNEFSDSVYSFSYPAHWMYERFSPRIERDGIELSNLSWNNSGVITSGNTINGRNVIWDGDLLMDFSNNKVYRVYLNANNQLALADRSNSLNVSVSDNNVAVKIIAQGSENKLSQSTGHVMSLGNPIVNNQLQINSKTRVLDSKAMTFKQFALDDVPCYCSDIIPDPPLALLQSGSNFTLDVRLQAKSHRWYPETEYLVKRDREYTQESGHRFDLRRDGIYESFTPFWRRTSAGWIKDPTAWTFMQANTMVNTFGKPEEFMDPFNRFTTVKWGHNQTLKRTEIFNVNRYEGLVEDFEFNASENCLDGVKYPGDAGQSEGHTGINSLRITPGQEVLIEGKSNN